MIEQRTGYKFNNENAARNAQSALRVHYLDGRPLNPDGKPSVTTEWVSVEFNDGASGTFYYFLGDYSPVLGNDPQTFNIDIEEI